MGALSLSFPPPTWLIGHSLLSLVDSLCLMPPGVMISGEAQAKAGKDSGQTLPGDTDPRKEGVKTSPGSWQLGRDVLH